MYTEQLTEEQLRDFYEKNVIIVTNEDGNESKFKYQLHANGKYYNFDKEKFGYTMFLKDYTVNVSWIKGPIKQQIIDNYQRYMSSLFEDYSADLYDHEQAKENKSNL